MSKLGKNWVYGGIVLGLTLSGCASTPDRKLDEKVGREDTVSSRKDLQSEADKLIESSPSITEAERTQLVTMRNSVRAQLDGLTNQSLRLRSVLLKDLLASNYDADEVEQIKSRLKKVEVDRLSALLGAVEKTNTILGHQEITNHVVESMFSEYGGRP